MRMILLFVLALSMASCGTNRNVYKSGDFDNRAYRHQTVAVLPVKITQTGHVSKKETTASIDASNEKWGYIFQETLLSYSLRHTSKNKKEPVISFQGTQKTNALLNEAGLTAIDSIYNKTPEELAALLKVDAVIMTTLERDKNFSDGVAYGLAAGRAVLNVLSRTPTVGAPLNQNSSDINMNAYLYDGKDGRMLWKTFRKGGTDLPSDVNGLVEYYSNWIAKKLPYRS
ncbi:MAG TPA: hypothetical protein VGE66_02775 [Chitinophagaceae bacterium]